MNIYNFYHILFDISLHLNIFYILQIYYDLIEIYKHFLISS